MAQPRRSSASMSRVRSDQSKVKLLNRSLDAELQSTLDEINRKQVVSRVNISHINKRIAAEAQGDNLMREMYRLGIIDNSDESESFTLGNLSVIGRELRATSAVDANRDFGDLKPSRLRSAPSKLHSYQMRSQHDWSDDEDNSAGKKSYPTDSSHRSSNRRSPSRAEMLRNYRGNRLLLLAQPRVSAIDLTRAQMNVIRSRGERMNRIARVELIRHGLTSNPILVEPPASEESSAFSRTELLRALKAKQSAAADNIYKQIKLFCKQPLPNATLLRSPLF